MNDGDDYDSSLDWSLLNIDTHDTVCVPVLRGNVNEAEDRIVYGTFGTASDPGIRHITYLGDEYARMHNKFIVLCKRLRTDNKNGTSTDAYYKLRNTQNKREPEHKRTGYSLDAYFGHRTGDGYPCYVATGYDVVLLQPIMVWTGSYNFTKAAERSAENAVLISNSHVAASYAMEWTQLYARATGDPFVEIVVANHDIEVDWPDEYYERYGMPAGWDRSMYLEEDPDAYKLAPYEMTPKLRLDLIMAWNDLQAKLS